MWQSLTAVTIACLMTFPAHAEAQFSMTGRYEGIYACDSTTAGVPASWGRPMSAGIVQTGNKIRIDLTYTDKVEGGLEYSLYKGEVSLSPDGGLVAGYFQSCGATFPALELVRIFPASTQSDVFSFAADGVWTSSQTPNIPGLIVQSCKWSLRRVSTATPTVRPCTD